ncbi:hypothetical protein STEG23_004911 [Scotinomys teguina]
MKTEPGSEFSSAHEALKGVIKSSQLLKYPFYSTGISNFLKADSYIDSPTLRPTNEMATLHPGLGGHGGTHHSLEQGIHISKKQEWGVQFLIKKEGSEHLLSQSLSPILPSHPLISSSSVSIQEKHCSWEKAPEPKCQEYGSVDGEGKKDSSRQIASSDEQPLRN